MASFGSSMRLWKSSMFSNTTARPLCFMSLGVAAEGLMMAPSGQRLPRSTAMPEFFLKGFVMYQLKKHLKNNYGIEVLRGNICPDGDIITRTDATLKLMKENYNTA